MTKQDILKLKTKSEIMKTFMDHPELWDDEVNDHLKAVAKKELIDRYGSEDVLYTLPQK
jgi:hypothetical protein